MKFSKLSQLVLVSAMGLLVATLLTACNLVTIDYVFVAASAGTSAGSAGQIYAYAVDAESGAIRSAVPAVSSGGTNPVAMAIDFGLQQSLCRQPGRQHRGPFHHRRQWRSDPAGLDYPVHPPGVPGGECRRTPTCTWFRAPAPRP